MKKVILYSLSTCVYCNAIEKMLSDLEVIHECIQVDELSDEEREPAIEQLKKITPQYSFPTVLIDQIVITGYKVQDIKEALGIRTEVDDLFEKLFKINAPKGYWFNNDKEITFGLLRSLLINKERYGYMACPCRLASGKRDQDRDIICPCDYRQPDVEEYGSCFCGLYVSENWNNRKIVRELVPERRGESSCIV
ncbi:MAG: glutaredoxin [Candidatus Electrothrix sp. AR3]|nr:glutaredoxin [Candidatus Electrothrix sp. AR3]